MAKKNMFNEKVPLGVLKDRVDKSSSPYYFQPSAVKFFGAKVEGSPLRNEKGDILFKEKYTNAPDRKANYKVSVYDSKSNELKNSDLYTSKSQRDEVYQKIQKGEKVELY